MARKTKAKRKTKITISKKVSSESKLFAFIATFFTLLGFLIAIVAKRKDKYVMHYAKNGLVIFLLFFVIRIFDWTFGIIPFYGSTITFFMSTGVVILWLASWIYALSGDKSNIIIVSDIAKAIKL